MIRNLLGASGSSQAMVYKTDFFGDSSGVALYRLDGNTNDTGGNYHGTETAVTYGGGVHARGAVFNGTTAKVDITSLISMGVSNSISAYFYTTSTATQSIAEYSNGTNLIAIYYDATTFKIRIDALLYSVALVVPKGSYNHCVVSIASSIPTLTINGVEQTLTSSAVTAIAGTSGLRIGVANIATVQTYMNGLIDHVRLFNRAITATEAVMLYAEAEPTSIVDNSNPFGDSKCKATYQFNGNANDLAGVYNGVVTGTPTYATGKLGQGLVCAQTTSPYIVTPALGDLTSICGWVKFTTLPTANFVTLWAEIAGSNTRTLVYYVSAGVYSIRSLFQKGASYYGGTHTVNVSLTTGVWYHICTMLTVDNREVTYLNGTLVDSITTTGTAGTSATQLLIGKYNTSLTQYMLDGVIDQIRFFTKQLTPMEVAALYNETTPLEEPLSTLVDPFKDGSGKALYRLEGNALDESGNYNGTATALTYGNSSNGRCAVFNGTSSYISSTTATLGVSTFSYSLWVNPSTVSTTAKHMIDFVTNRCALTNGNGTTSVVSYYDGAYKSFTYTLTASVTTHLVLVVVGTSATLFADGVSQGTITVTSLSPSGGVRLGSNSTNNGLWYAGNEDQIRFFNRALTQTEVTTLYNAGA